MKIEKDFTISQVLNANPKASEILLQYGMHCLGCLIASGETLAEAAQAHGIDPDELVQALNEEA